MMFLDRNNGPKNLKILEEIKDEILTPKILKIMKKNIINKNSIRYLKNLITFMQVQFN